MLSDFKYWYAARVVNVVDGDTVDIEIDLGLRIYFRDRFRLAQIDAFEINDQDPQKREMAKVARQYVIQKTLNKNVIVHTKKDFKDKYGRWLVTIYYFVEGENKDWVNLNKELVKNGMALDY